MGIIVPDSLQMFYITKVRLGRIGMAGYATKTYKAT